MRSLKPTATCTTDGYQIFECSFCGDRYTDSQYTAQHPALGHDWGTNTDTEDTATPADDKLEGWYTVSAADCLNAQVLERKCARCGETEQKTGTLALGHITGYVNGVEQKCTTPCLVDEDLIDAEGNDGYAFVCARENCPVEVPINNRGDVAHYITAEAHKLVAGENDADHPAATCEDEGYTAQKCSVCGTEVFTEVDALGHDYNTLQKDGDEVVVCVADEDIGTQKDYLDFMRALVGNATYLQNSGKYLAAWQAAKADCTLTGLKDNELPISRVCTRCGAPTVAYGHEYIIAKYVEGSSSEYEVDENGLPVDYSDEVTVATMDCRYVQVCKNGCGEILARGQHKDVSAATCRQGGVCSVCGVQVTSRLAHKYIDVASIIKEKDETKTDTGIKYGDNNVTWKQAYDAYVKVSATETWMTPVEGSCDEKGTTVHVCLVCLMDAAKADSDVAWTQDTKTPTGDIGKWDDGVAQTKVNAYVVTKDVNHDYQPTFFNLAGEEIDKEDTSCQVGFYTKWICSKCEAVFTNVPVADDTATDENEAKDNKPVAPVEDAEAIFTDSNGFVINTPANYNKEETFNATALAAALADRDNNYGKHDLKVMENYWLVGGYVAPTCASPAIVTYVCEHCGYSTVAAYTDDESKFVGVASIDDSAMAMRPADKDENSNNHAGEVYGCGVHCNYKSADGTNLCGKIESDGTKDKSHDALTVTYELVKGDKQYYSDENYTLKVARVGAESKDPTKAASIENNLVALLDGTKVVECLNSGSYKKPLTTNFSVPDEGETADYLVLVDKDGKIYSIVSDKIAFYTEDDGKYESGAVSDGAAVEQNDNFFVKLGAYGSSVTAAPLYAFDATSLGYALGAAPVNEGTTAKPEMVLTVNFSADGTYALNDAIERATLTNVDRVVFNLNGHKITLTDDSTDYGFSAGNWEEVGLEYVFENGTVVTTEDTAFDTTYLTLDGIILDHTGSVAAVVANRESRLVITDSKIYSTAVYGIRTNDETDPAAGETWKYDSKIEITNSTVIMNPSKNALGQVTGTAETNVNNVALYVSQPSTVTVKDSTLSANRQVAVVRSGNVTFTGSTLTLVAGYVSPNERPEGVDEISGYSNLEDYLLAGHWTENGNEVVHAALVMGNSESGAAFDSQITVILSDTTVNVASGDMKVYIASNYDEDVLVENGYDAEKDEDMPTMVFFNAGNCVADSEINVGYGWTVGTIRLVNCGDISGTM